ncbi:MAG: zf-HC2 domain-containing protein [Mariprofundales bacterium]|nr:zf-HC2 domain-containing protein [Mariprofundales bacterium]
MNHFCRQASRLASDQLDLPLGLVDRMHLWLHLVMCTACRNNARALQKLHRMVATRDSVQKLDLEQQQRIADALHRECD